MAFLFDNSIESLLYNTIYMSGSLQYRICIWTSRPINYVFFRLLRYYIVVSCEKSICQKLCFFSLVFVLYLQFNGRSLEIPLYVLYTVFLTLSKTYLRSRLEEYSFLNNVEFFFKTMLVFHCHGSSLFCKVIVLSCSLYEFVNP